MIVQVLTGQPRSPDSRSLLRYMGHFGGVVRDGKLGSGPENSSCKAQVTDTTEAGCFLSARHCEQLQDLDKPLPQDLSGHSRRT